MLILEQILNGLQLGMLLFLMAAGLTLIVGVMDIINLAHGSLLMVGAYASVLIFGETDSFILSITGGVLAGLLAGLLIEIIVIRALYRRDHLDQVLATFGLLLLFNDGIRVLLGSNVLYASIPNFLSGQIEILPNMPYPAYRFAVIALGLLMAALLHILITHTKAGMLIRAGASDREMVQALGVNIKLLYTTVFGLGAMMAAIAGLAAAPLLTVEPGMGEPFLILSFVVIVVGGLGSIKGAFLAALVIGLVDTLGRAFLTPTLSGIIGPNAAQNAGPALGAILIYVLMAGILLKKPTGLFGQTSKQNQYLRSLLNIKLWGKNDIN